MHYDLHPIAVHFPIALLSLYCLLEFVSFGKLQTSRSFRFAKALLATIGGISLLAARQFGDTAKHMLTDKSLMAVVSRHEQFANLSVLVFAVVGMAYTITFVRLYVESHPQSAWNVLAPLFALEKIFTQTVLSQIFALAGLLLLVITGALGGSIVYGAAKDPVTQFIYNLVF